MWRRYPIRIGCCRVICHLAMRLIAVSGGGSNIRLTGSAGCGQSLSEQRARPSGVLDRESHHFSSDLGRLLSNYLILRYIFIFHNIPYANRLFACGGSPRRKMGLLLQRVLVRTATPAKPLRSLGIMRRSQRCEARLPSVCDQDKSRRRTLCFEGPHLYPSRATNRPCHARRSQIQAWIAGITGFRASGDGATLGRAALHGASVNPKRPHNCKASSAIAYSIQWNVPLALEEMDNGGRRS